MNYPRAIGLDDDGVGVDDNGLVPVRQRVPAALIRRAPEWACVLRVFDLAAIGRGASVDQRQEWSGRMTNTVLTTGGDDREEAGKEMATQ